MIENYKDIKEGMDLRSESEEYEGDVISLNGVLHTNVMGWGYTPISELDLNDITIIEGGIA